LGLTFLDISMYTTQAGTQLHQPANHARAAVAILGTLLVGTGSAFPMERAEEWRPYVQARVPFDVGVQVKSTGCPSPLDVRTAVEHIENIRSVLSPSVSDLASLFNISRQTVYKWLSGDSNPEPENMSHIVELSRIADAFKTAQISRSDSLLKMKTFNGRSLMELIKAGENCTSQVSALIAEAKAMEASYNQSGLAASKTKPTSDWQSYISIPGSSELDSQG
jgi:hypothetical protein